MSRGYRAIALLLDYPSAALLSNLSEVRAALADLAPGAAGRIEPLFARLGSSEPLELEEAWVETFDRGRRTSLNLFEHVHGDSRDRGQAMVDLLAMYEAAGLSFESEQLPDYLPAFLDYLTLLPADAAREQLLEVAHILEIIHGALARRDSDYAPVFEFLLGQCGIEPSRDLPIGADEDDTSPQALDRAWADAPVEFLGAAAPCDSPAQSSVRPINIHRGTHLQGRPL